MRSVHELSMEEAYKLVSEHFGHPLLAQEAVKNEDWCRDYVLEHFRRHSPEELAAAGLTWETAPDNDDSPGEDDARLDPEDDG
jgi:hypothetical protein